MINYSLFDRRIATKDNANYLESENVIKVEMCLCDSSDSDSEDDTGDHKSNSGENNNNGTPDDTNHSYDTIDDGQNQQEDFYYCNFCFS